MTWLMWRQHRAQAFWAAFLLTALGILLAITGVAMAHEYHRALTGCADANASCAGLQLFKDDSAVVTVVNLTVAVPLLVGVFWGVTSVGRDYEAGTHVLAWTQSITRRRWLRGKVITLVVASVVAGAVVSGMVTWWSRTLNLLHDDRFQGLQFDIQGLMPVAYTLFASALGLFAGVVWRRVLPAIATTVAGFVAVRLPIEIWARPRFATPVTTVGDKPPGAWGSGSDLRFHGRVITGPVRVPESCSGTFSRAGMDECMARHGYRVTSTYQPAGRYWTFQWIETSIFVAIAALLVAAAVALVLRRDA